MSTLTMFHGDTPTFSATISNLSSSGLAGCELWMTAKRAATDPDSAAVFQKPNASWVIDQTGNASTPGIAHVQLANADTASLPLYPVALVYDIQLKDASGDIYTIDSGTLTVTPDVTQATS